MYALVLALLIHPASLDARLKTALQICRSYDHTLLKYECRDLYYCVKTGCNPAEYVTQIIETARKNSF